MMMKDKIELLSCKMSDEVNGAKEYYHVYLATNNLKYLEMAKQELSHAEQFMMESIEMSKEIDIKSNFCYYKETESLEKCYRKIREMQDILKEY
ncbi:MAG: hypothetical protein R3Y09_06575 [Clostridia bacterium]